MLKFQTVKLRDDVDVAALTVDPEELKLARLETAEEEKEESREKVLGLVDFGEGAPMRPRRDKTKKTSSPTRRWGRSPRAKKEGSPSSLSPKKTEEEPS